MKQPYIYTMPESFLSDQSVPARWRLLAVLNSFLLNGKEFFGSNAWLMEQLGCSRPTVSSAIDELEKLGEIICERTLTTRIIKRKHKGAAELTGEESQFTGGGKLMPTNPVNQLTPISDSNSESINTADADFEIHLEKDTDDFVELSPDRQKLTKRVREAYDQMIKWAEVERGFQFLLTERTKQYKAFKIAKQNGFTAKQLKERWTEMASNKFWIDAGFDWMNVVTSFNKKQ